MPEGQSPLPLDAAGAPECCDWAQFVVGIAVDILEAVEDGKFSVLKEGIPMLFDNWRRGKDAIEGTGEIPEEVKRVGLVVLTAAADEQIDMTLKFPDKFAREEEIVKAWTEFVKAGVRAGFLTFGKKD